MRLASSIRAWLAISGVLMAGVPVWQHAHVAGDRPHSHSHALAHGHGHQHEHEGLGTAHAHQHIRLFGVEFAIPLAPDHDDSQEGPTTFLTTNPTVVENSVSGWNCVALAAPVLAVEPALVVAPPFREVMDDTDILSDTARQQRFSVLLI